MLFILCLFGAVYGHMGITKVCNGATCVSSREQPVVGDNYRFPNAGHCHGVIAPSEPAQSRFQAGAELTLTLSGGAAHNGGHCALFLAKKTDGEGTWYKQMDFIDCTNVKDFKWTIEPALVPTECNTQKGCTLIWAWTPRSSGACEIYMNCFDLGIDGANGGASPSGAITVVKNPPCFRVNNNDKKTQTYGTFCGTDCNTGGGTVVTVPTITAAPTATGVTNPPSTNAPTAATTTISNNRCGKDWFDANSGCKSICTIQDEATSCFPPDKCYADMVKVCENSPTAGPVLTTNCEAIGVWSGTATMHKWCATNCPGICPASHCKCTQGTAKFVAESTTEYTPSCQKKIVGSGETIMNLTVEYDLSSYINGVDDIDQATMDAAEELLKFNQGCGAISVNDVNEQIGEGKTIFITGDCQLTDDCPQPSSANKYSLSSIFMAVLAIYLSLGL